ncbi:MAG: extracellular solute-binding protein, partial [Pseudonocardiaceae bacterium]
MLDRRTFLAGSASAGLAAVAAVTGCSGGGLLGLGDTVKVAVAWSGTELNAFRAVLDALELRDYRVELIPLGDDIATAFAQHTSRRPDVILLPQPGLVATHLDMLAPLPDTIATEPWPYSEVWKPLLFHGSGSDKRLYGLPFKVTHKSVVWYRKSVFASHGLVSPQRWSEWLALNDALIDGGVVPLALAGA